jgi:ribonuclease Y
MEPLQLVLVPAANSYILPIVLAMVGLAVGLLLGALLRRKLSEQKVRATEDEAKRLVEDAQRQATEIVSQTEAETQRKQIERERKFERDLQKRRVEIDRIEGRIKRREEHIDQREEQISRREQSLTDKERRLDSRLGEVENAKKDIDSLKRTLIAKCEEISGLTTEQAKKMLLEQLDTELHQEQAAAVRRVENETREIAEKKARQIITLAIQKCATDQVSETTVSVVHLPNDEMKGRIIGREGRNIRTLEQLTGVNIIVDDTPEAVVISCFDPLRREVARLTLEKLISDGRIHPARVEELVEKGER